MDTPKSPEDAWSDLPVYDASKRSMAAIVGGRLRRISRTGVYVALASILSIAGLYLLSQLDYHGRPTFARLDDKVASHETPDCSPRYNISSMDIWNKAAVRYNHLMDDKFTIAIQTYRRPDQLKATLDLLLAPEIPSLHEIVIIWNDLETPTPADFTSDHNVTVRHRMSTANSLNQKLLPDAGFQTQAILLSDDDVHYDAADLDFVFQQWRAHGRNRLTGAFARCVDQNPDNGQWQYGWCKGHESYSMVLTGLSFVHMAFLDYYSSEDPLMTRVRAYVDEHFNCEDIAMNFVTSMLTCEGPLQVSGLHRPTNEAPKAGISTKPGHLEARHACISSYVDMFGHMPLVETSEYISRGYVSG